MTDAQFNKFVATSVRALARKNAILNEEFGLGTFARWAYEQTTEALTFLDETDRVLVEARAISVGSYSSKSETWQWSWANASVPDESRANARPLQELFGKTGIEVFRMEAFDADEEMAWELASMAVAHLGAVGCYRAPTNHLSVYLAIMTIRSLSE